MDDIYLFLSFELEDDNMYYLLASTPILEQNKGMVLTSLNSTTIVNWNIVFASLALCTTIGYVFFSFWSSTLIFRVLATIFLCLTIYFVAICVAGNKQESFTPFLKYYEMVKSIYRKASELGWNIDATPESNLDLLLDTYKQSRNKSLVDFMQSINSMDNIKILNIKQREDWDRKIKFCDKLGINSFLTENQIKLALNDILGMIDLFSSQITLGENGQNLVTLTNSLKLSFKNLATLREEPSFAIENATLIKELMISLGVGTYDDMLASLPRYQDSLFQLQLQKLSDLTNRLTNLPSNNFLFLERMKQLFPRDTTKDVLEKIGNYLRDLCKQPYYSENTAILQQKKSKTISLEEDSSGNHYITLSNIHRNFLIGMSYLSEIDPQNIQHNDLSHLPIWTKNILYGINWLSMFNIMFADVSTPNIKYAMFFGDQYEMFGSEVPIPGSKITFSQAIFDLFHNVNNGATTGQYDALSSGPVNRINVNIGG